LCVPGVDVVVDRLGWSAWDKDGSIRGKGWVVVGASLVLVLAVAVDDNISALSGRWHRGQKEDGISAITA